MSRLKGADLGISVPSGALNYRGQWSSGATYAVDDVVGDAGLLWLALAAVPSSLSAPSLVPTYPSATPVGGGAAGGGSAAALYSVAHPFTVDGPVSVGSIQIPFGADASGTTFRVGIATALGANDASVTWLGATPSTAAGPSSATTKTFNLPAAVTLVASTTYYVVVEVTAGGFSQVAWTASGLAVSGHVATIGQLQRTSSIGGAWGGNTFNLPFTLYPPASPYWQSIPTTQDQVSNTTASGAAVALPDVTVATTHSVTLTANCTITLPAPVAGKKLRVEVIQDATGSRTLAWASASGSILWPGGTTATQTATANKRDLYEFVCASGTTWLARALAQNF